MARTRHHSAIAVLGSLLVVTAVAVSVPAASADPTSGPAPCTRTETGAITGAQTVGAGEMLCLRGATVTGTVTVEPGGALLSRKSTVVGAVTLSGADTFIFCRSATVGGAVSSSGGVGAVRIGTNRKCGPSTVDGAMTVQGSRGNVIVAHATVAGAVTVDGNAPVSGKSTKLAGNVIGGDLSCAENAPAPANTGRPNTVTGVRSGQCTAVDF